MFDHRTELATLNNVFWCRAMFRAHDIDCASDDLAWCSDAAPPPLHSNLVVLSPAVGYKHVQRQLRAIEPAWLPNILSMKDSFAALDLSPDEYEILFDANWIRREAGLPSHPDSKGAPGAWTTVTSPAGLRAWEDAWRADARNRLDAPTSCQFPASLLDSPNHRFFVKLDEQGIVAGAIANRSPGAVGLSNTFGPGSATFNDWEGLIQCAAEHFPGIPLVGYERGLALECAQSAGFAPVGALRVWSRAPQPASGRAASDA